MNNWNEHLLYLLVSLFIVVVLWLVNFWYMPTGVVTLVFAYVFIQAARLLEGTARTFVFWLLGLGVLIFYGYMALQNLIPSSTQQRVKEFGDSVRARAEEEIRQPCQGIPEDLCPDARKGLQVYAEAVEIVLQQKLLKKMSELDATAVDPDEIATRLQEKQSTLSEKEINFLVAKDAVELYRRELMRGERLQLLSVGWFWVIGLPLVFAVAIAYGGGAYGQVAGWNWSRASAAFFGGAGALAFSSFLISLGAFDWVTDSTTSKEVYVAAIAPTFVALATGITLARIDVQKPWYNTLGWTIVFLTLLMWGYVGVSWTVAWMGAATGMPDLIKKFNTLGPEWQIAAIIVLLVLLVIVLEPQKKQNVVVIPPARP